MYHIAFLVLFVGVVYEIKNRNTSHKLFCVAYIILAAMLFFRYGQGIDYLNYAPLYNSTPIDIVAAVTDPSLHGETGWRLLCVFFRWMNIPYSGFVAAISVVEMVLLWRFVIRFCKNRSLALLLVYHTLFLTYFFSALRQGFALAIFLGVLLELLFKKKYMHYVIGCILCASFHSSMLLLVVLPILQHGFFSSLKIQILFVCAAWGAGLVIATGLFDGILTAILPHNLAFYFNNRSISIVAIAERIVTYAVTVVAFYTYKTNKKSVPAHHEMLMKIISFGMVVYGGTFWVALVASRLAYAYKVVEIALLSSILLPEFSLAIPKWGIPAVTRCVPMMNRILAFANRFLAKVRCNLPLLDEEHPVQALNYSWIATLYCLALATVMYVKNILSYIEQAPYLPSVNFFNYPYFTWLDKEGLLNFMEWAVERLP